MKKIIISYLDGSISNKDLDRLKVWIEKPKNQEEFKEFVRINYQLNGLSSKVDTDEAFNKVLKKITDAEDSSPGLLVTFLKYAAIFIGISVIGYGIYQRIPQDTYVPHEPQIVLQLEDGTKQIVYEGQSTVINNASGHKVTEQNRQELVYSSSDSSLTELRYNTLKVPYGKTFGLILSDESKIILNAGSELRYPVQFVEHERNRTVFLNGEAFFEVAKDEEHPFVVETKDMAIQVLGTVFNVTSYTDDQKAYTVLVEGKVAAHNKLRDQDSKVISPSEKVYFDDSLLKSKMVNVEKYIAWVQGQLVFADDSFKVIKNKLERKYNVTINNTYAALDEIHITATFKNEDIDQVLKIFQTYMAFDYGIKDGVVTITEPK